MTDVWESSVAKAESPARRAVDETKAIDWRTDLIAATVAILLGVVMAVLPVLLWWPKVGEPVWVADGDELYYLQIAGQAYFQHPTQLGDPVLTTPGGGSAYPALTMAPAVVAARALNAGPQTVGFFWRICAGIGLGLTTYLLFRQAVGRPFVALALACLILTDCGALSGQMIVRPWLTAAKVVTGHAGDLLARGPVISPLWRMVNPGLSLPFLLGHVWLVLRARERPTTSSLALAGWGFGLLFYVYFYFYTAAFLALVIAFAVDSGRRRVYFSTLFVGGLIGLPGILANSAFSKSTPPDWLNRADKFVVIPRFSELLIPTIAIVIMIAGLAWVMLRRRDLIYVALLGPVGLLLANNQVLTQRQIENFHWVYVWGIMASILVMLMAVEVLSRGVNGRRWAGVVLAVGCVGQVVLGLWLHGVEVTRSAEPVALEDDYLRYRADRLVQGSEPLEANSVIAGDPSFVPFAAIVEDQRPLSGYSVWFSPYVDDASWNDRSALNAILLGQSLTEYEVDQLSAVGSPFLRGAESRDPARKATMLAKRLAAYREVERDGQKFLDRFKVRYVAQPAGREMPEALGKGWRKVRSGATWDVYAAPPISGR